MDRHLTPACAAAFALLLCGCGQQPSPPSAEKTVPAVIDAGVEAEVTNFGEVDDPEGVAEGYRIVWVYWTIRHTRGARIPADHLPYPVLRAPDGRVFEADHRVLKPQGARDYQTMGPVDLEKGATLQGAEIVTVPIDYYDRGDISAEWRRVEFLTAAPPVASE
jgi:hypothetical protein